MSTWRVLYRCVLAPACTAPDGETPTLLELQDAGELLVLMFSNQDGNVIVRAWRGCHRDRALEESVHLAGRRDVLAVELEQGVHVGGRS